MVYTQCRDGVMGNGNKETTMNPLKQALTIRVAVDDIRKGWGGQISRTEGIGQALIRLEKLADELEKEGSK